MPLPPQSTSAPKLRRALRDEASTPRSTTRGLLVLSPCLWSSEEEEQQAEGGWAPSSRQQPSIRALQRPR